MACVAAQGLRNPRLSPGDVVLIRTGHGVWMLQRREHVV